MDGETENEEEERGRLLYSRISSSAQCARGSAYMSHDSSSAAGWETTGLKEDQWRRRSPVLSADVVRRVDLALGRTTVKQISRLGPPMFGVEL